MKRARDEDDDVYRGPVPRRSTISEPSGKPHMLGGGSAQKLTTNDALAYLKEVRDMFHDKKEKYDEFLEVMKDFKAQRIDSTGVIARVKELFKGHRELILGFNTFLPKGSEITLPDEPQQFKKPVDFEVAIQFVNKIKKRFEADDGVYKSFLDILNVYRMKSKSISEVHQEVTALLHDQQDLLQEFINFLPDSSAAASKNYIHTSRNHSRRREDRSTPMTMIKPLDVEKKVIASHAEYNISVDRPDPDTDGGLIKAEKEHRRHPEDQRESRQDERDFVNEGTQQFSQKRKSACTLEDSVTELFHRDMHSQVLRLREKVKERLCNSEAYQEFLKCIAHYRTENITRPQLQSLVNDLLGAYPDLMEEVNNFIDRSEKTGSLWSDEHLAGSVKVEDGDGDRDLDRDERSMAHDIKERNRRSASKDASSSKPSPLSSKEKYHGKPIQELDLSNCESCTPSYRLLPKNYPIPSSSHRTDIGAEVLNDHWVSVTSGSEDYSFKHMRKNQYEESLFRCEDDRFELDMLLESVNTTAKRVEELLDRINDNSIKPENLPHIEEQFTALNMRCIERLYGDHGPDVMDVLKKNAYLALPVILTRLKQKQEEWVRCRSDFNKIWADIYARNYHKSLDHRSFYFKQQDSKSLSAKALLLEIKEISEQKSDDDKILQYISAQRRINTPHLEFKYSDQQVHDDLYQLIKYSCEEMCSSEQYEKAMKVWTGFVEPMLGVPSRCSEDATKSSSMVARQSDGKIVHGARNFKPSDIPKNGEDNVLAANHSSRPCLVNSNSAVKEDGSNDADHFGGKKDSSCNTRRHETLQTDVTATGEMSEFSKKGISNRQIVISNALVAAPEDTHGIVGGEYLQGMDKVVAENGEVDLRSDVIIPSSEVRNCKRISSLNGVVGEKGRIKRLHCETASHFKIEREEGELSPTGDFEEEHFVVYGDTSKEAARKLKDIRMSKGSHQYRHRERVIQNEVDVEDEGEESGQRSSDDSDNAFENGDVTGSESVDVEDHSPEEHGNKGECEGEAEGLGDAHDAEGDGTLLPSSERFMRTAKPLTKYVPGALQIKENDSRVFYGNDAFYVFFRLHQTLYSRLEEAKGRSANNNWKSSSDAKQNDSYARFLEILYNFLDAGDSTKYEDECRTALGSWSFPLFTLDKLIAKLSKQLVAIATDDVGDKLLRLYAYECMRKPGRLLDEVYHANASVIITDDNIYRFECSSIPETEKQAQLTIQLMDSGYDMSEAPAVLMDPNFEAALNNRFLSVGSEEKSYGCFLKRNKRKFDCVDEGLAMVEALDSVTIVNGLEHKINCSTYKMSYVLDTSDFMLRKGWKSSARSRRHELGNSSNGNSRRVVKFQKWLSSKIQSVETKDQCG